MVTANDEQQLVEPYDSLVRDISGFRQYYDESAVRHRRLTLATQRLSTFLGMVAVVLLAIKAVDLGSRSSGWLSSIGLIRSDGPLGSSLAQVDGNVAFPALVIGSVAVWISGYAEKRGYVRAWTRSALMRTQLDAAVAGIRALSRMDPFDDPAKKTARREEAAKIAMHAIRLTVPEAEHWKAEMTRDFARVVKMMQNGTHGDA